MSDVQFYPYARQSINEQDLQAVGKALTQDIITRGESVRRFEEEVAAYCQASFAVAFNSGTSALFAACYAAGVSSYDRLITTPNSFVASTTCGMRLGARPLFVDIDLSTGNLNLEHVVATVHESKATRGRNIIIPVHFAGIPVDMQKLDGLIKDPDAVIIEDAAHAFGTSYSNGKKVGSCEWSLMTVFSFHPAKTITTGEGGMVLTNCQETFKKLQYFRNNGIERSAEAWIDPYLPYQGYYQVVDGGCGNYNFTDFQAALGLSQLQRIDSFIEKRRKLLREYRACLEGFSYIRMFSDLYDSQTAYHLAVAQIDFAAFNTTREQVMAELWNQGIGTQVHYIPIYRHPFFQNKNGDISEYFPKMEQYYSQALSLPLYYDLEKKDVMKIANILKDILVEFRQKKRSKVKKGAKRSYP